MDGQPLLLLALCGLFVVLVVAFWVIPLFWARRVAIDKGYSASVGCGLGLILGPLGIVVAYLLPPTDTAVEFPRYPAPQSDDPYQHLLSRARGDKELVERLIEYERERAPTANRQTLVQNALLHWNRDNGLATTFSPTSQALADSPQQAVVNGVQQATEDPLKRRTSSWGCGVVLVAMSAILWLFFARLWWLWLLLGFLGYLLLWKTEKEQDTRVFRITNAILVIVGNVILWVFFAELHQVRQSFGCFSYLLLSTVLLGWASSSSKEGKCKWVARVFWIISGISLIVGGVILWSSFKELWWSWLALSLLGYGLLWNVIGEWASPQKEAKWVSPIFALTGGVMSIAVSVILWLSRTGPWWVWAVLAIVGYLMLWSGSNDWMNAIGKGKWVTPVFTIVSVALLISVGVMLWPLYSELRWLWLTLGLLGYAVILSIALLASSTVEITRAREKTNIKDTIMNCFWDMIVTGVWFPGTAPKVIIGVGMGVPLFVGGIVLWSINPAYAIVQLILCLVGQGLVFSALVPVDKGKEFVTTASLRPWVVLFIGIVLFVLVLPFVFYTSVRLLTIEYAVTIFVLNATFYLWERAFWAITFQMFRSFREEYSASTV